MALFTELLWVALLGLIHTKYQKSAGLVDYKQLKDTHWTVVRTVNQTHRSTEYFMLCYRTISDRKPPKV
jgi:hypothetical protein